MKSRLRVVLAALVVAVAALALTACGGSKKSSGSSSSGGSGGSASQLIDQTFSGSHPVHSGNLKLALTVTAPNDPTVKGPVKVSLTGPFQSMGAKQLPKFDMTLGATVNGQTFNAGLATDGNGAVVKFQGQNYAVPASLFTQFKQSFNQAQSSSTSGTSGSLKDLGIDPKSLIGSPKIVGDENIGGTDTTHISAPVDVNGIASAVDKLLANAGKLGLPQTSQLPSQLSPAQKQQLTQAVKNATIDLWTGKSDHTLRKFELKATISAQSSGKTQTATIDVSVEIDNANQTQSVSLPGNTKPLTDLTSQLGGLGGALGGLGGSSTGSGSTGGGSSSGSGATNDKIKKYQTCIQAAGTDITKAQKCAKLLTG